MTTNISADVDSIMERAKPIIAEEIDNQLSFDLMDNPDVNRVASDFRRAIPKIKLLASGLSLRGLNRVFRAVVEFPLADEYPVLKDKENELFVLTLAAMSYKGIMTSAFNKHAAETKKTIESEMATVANTVEGEVTNG